MSSIPPPHTAKVLKIFEENQTLTNDLVREIFTILENFAITKKMLSKIASKSEWFNGILENSGLNTLDLRVFFRDYYPDYEGYLKALKCPVCGKQMHYSPATNKIPIGCSSKCILAATKDKRCNTIINKYGGMGSASKAIRAKAEQTNLERYGTKNVRSSDFVKDKIRNTMMERYGVENALQSKEIRQKGEQTLIERYGVKNAQMNEEIKSKRIATNNERYGGNAPTCSKEVMDKVFATNIERYGVKTNFNSKNVDGKDNQLRIEIDKDRLKKSYDRLFTMEEIEPSFSVDEWRGFGTLKTMKIYPWRCKKCGNVFNSYLWSPWTPPRCLICHPHNISVGQSELEDFVKNDLGFEVVRNDRKALDGKYEIDVYVPSLKLGFEYNGEFFHSDNGEDYHINKTNYAESKGIHLIHVFETEWIYRKDAVKNFIRFVIGKLEKVDVSRCHIEEITSELKSKIMNENHISSDDGASKIKLGVFDRNELIGCVSLSKSLLGIEGYEYEITRFFMFKKCDGILNKVFSYIKEEYGITRVVMCLDRRFYSKDFNFLKANGFEFKYSTKPSYFYTKSKNPIVLKRPLKESVSEFLGENYDPSKTVHENMTDLGFVRNFDCGNLVYVKSF